MIRKILAPTDLSHNSKAGIGYAVSLARENRAQLILLYVTSIPFHEFQGICEVANFASGPVPQLTIDYYLRAAKGDLSHFIYVYFADAIKGLNSSLNVAFGRISREIVRVADHEESDLIVMAKRKRPIPFSLFSHSVSEAVSRQASCPVLTICPPHIRRPQFARRTPFFGTVLQRSEVY
jgi:nucleotide-binding universal stress UspA family protein